MAVKMRRDYHGPHGPVLSACARTEGEGNSFETARSAGTLFSRILLVAAFALRLIAQRIKHQRKRRRRLPAAWIVEMVACIDGTPVLQYLFEPALGHLCRHQ